MPKTINQLPPVAGNVGVEGLIAVSRGGMVKRTDLTMLRTVLANGGVDASEIPNGVLPSGRLPGYSLVPITAPADRYALTVPDQVKAGDIVITDDNGDDASLRSWQLVDEANVASPSGWSELPFPSYPVGVGTLVYTGSADGDTVVRVDGILLEEQVIAEGVGSISAWVTPMTLRLVGDKVYATDPDAISNITVSGGGTTTLNLHRLGSQTTTSVICSDETTITSLGTGYSLISYLDCNGCTGLTTLPDLPRAVYVYCYDCTNLTALPDLPECSHLNVNNTGVTSLPALPACTLLNAGTTGITALPALPLCVSITCSASAVVAIPTLPVAISIYCDNCLSLTTIQAQPMVVALQCIGCTSLVSLPSELPACITYTGSNCTSLTAIPALPMCQTVVCDGCTSLVSLPVELPECTALNVRDCTSLASVPAALPACAELEAFGCGMSVTAVNNALIALDANGLENGIVDVSGNSAPTGGGATAAANLVAKSWTVTTD